MSRDTECTKEELVQTIEEHGEMLKHMKADLIAAGAKFTTVRTDTAKDTTARLVRSSKRGDNPNHIPKQQRRTQAPIAIIRSLCIQEVCPICVAFVRSSLSRLTILFV